ncbi:hypothetical protein SAMN05444162_3792 [Paenibacillaceae bacterium GAS479]|nr:hypothetical protein SAMN05444162_3792 [Paenibacillaceae bacterium GAS479]
MIKRFVSILIITGLLIPAVVNAQPREQENTLMQVLLTTLSPGISNAITGY